MASIRSRIFRAILNGSHDGSRPIEESRTRIDDLGSRISLPGDVEVQSLAHFGIAGEWLIPKGAAASHCMLYLHGGGYVMGSARSHRAMAARIAKASGVRVFLLEYRLAPESPSPAALQDALRAFRWLTQQRYRPRNIALAGDGSGAGLALATAIALRDAGEPLPGRLVCISPWLDPTGELAGLPPILVHVGSDEARASDTRNLVERARAANVYIQVKEWIGMWHVFQALAPYMPEANAAISHIGVFIRAWKAPWRVGVEGLPPIARVLVANP